MGLIDLKTDLKSLKYGKDKVGGGSSKQPFVQKPIPDSFSGIGNTGGLDMFVRGGTLAIGKTADDVSRLTKLLLTPATFQGPAFTAQQNLLSRQGVQTQASPRGLNEGAYLPTSTLAQVAVSATGLHFNKQGLNPIPGLPGSLTTYSDVVDYRQDPEDNRLVKFTDDFVNKQTSGNTLFSYPGGPGSILGAGKTKIQTPIDQRTGANSLNSDYRYPVKYVDLKNAQFLLGASDKAVLSDETTGIYYSDKLDKYQLNQDFGADKVQGLTTTDFANYTSTGTINAINIGADSEYAYNNFPEVTLYKLGGLTDLNRLLGASVSASLLADFPGALPTTNNLVTPDSLRLQPSLGTRNSIENNTNSEYAISSGLTTPDNFELFTPNTSPDGLYEGNKPSAVERAMGTTPFTGDSAFTKPTEEARSNAEALESSQAFTYTQEQFKEATSYRQTGQVTDFRQQLRTRNNPTAKAVGADILAPDYNSQNIENRVHLGNPGTKGDVSNYVDGKVVQGKKGALDKINALPIYNSGSAASTKDKTVNDLVKFRIAILDANGEGNSSFIHFRAFLDTITDNYSAQWDSFKYVGRGENFYTYGGFERSVSMGWTVFAQSKQELIPMYKKLNFLAASLAPSYNNSFMQGTFAKLTIGGYLYEMPGVIKGLSYELSQEAPWEIGITGEGFVNQQGDSSVKELPHMIKVSGFEFIPIPDFMPRRQTTENGPSRFISLSNGVSNYDN